ncbi:hypothetical protein JHW43_007879 [Diplocarpon mali]|nr:hypothetical protein JHW43_007879 [Diplocarpon mali]
MDLVLFRSDSGAVDFTMDAFDDIDSETAALILQLQIEDSEELYASNDRKGKGKEGVFSDTQIALQIFKEEMQRSATVIADRQLTRSMYEACRTDGDEITMSLAQEQTAARDRQMSLIVSSVTEPLAITEGVVAEDELDDVLERLDALHMDATREDSAISEKSMALVPYGVMGNPVSESSTLAASRALLAPRHEYCGSCLQDLFNASITDDTLFPPRCCRELITPSGNVRIYLSTDIVQLYEAKKIEFDTPNRTYCSNPLCSSFIRVEHISGDQASCQRCRAVTCTICKSAAHRGDCPEDTALQLVLEVARDNGWQRCWSCHRMVELDTGCNHMTCPCSAQFCYKCGERWKTCLCEQWDEHRLYARANVVVARLPAPAQQPPEQRQARVAAVAQDLVARHNCGHTSWHYLRGRHELPSASLPQMQDE